MPYSTGRGPDDPHGRTSYAGVELVSTRRSEPPLAMSFLAARVTIEDMLDDAAGEFVFAEKHFAGVFFFEQHGLLFAVRAHDRFDARVNGARDLDHAPDIERVGGGDHQNARAVDMRLYQYIRVGSVAGNGRYTALAKLLDDFAIL